MGEMHRRLELQKLDSHALCKLSWNSEAARHGLGTHGQHIGTIAETTAASEQVQGLALAWAHDNLHKSPDE